VYGLNGPEVRGYALKCARLDIQHGELEIPPGALLSHSNHMAETSPARDYTTGKKEARDMVVFAKSAST